MLERSCVVLPLLLAALVCGGAGTGTSPEPAVETRGFRMGFSAFPPRPVADDYRRAVETWLPRADFALAVASVLRPSYLGLAAETNLIRVAAPRPVYDAMVAMTGAAAAELRAAGYASPLFVSVQVEAAWGRPQGAGFVGIATDLADFPFATALGLSSYPYLGGFAEPEQVPLDYFSRFNASGLPLLVTEGGWTSASVGALVSSPERQARWIRRQLELARAAQVRHVFQLLFTDLDLAAFGQAGNPQLVPFAAIGLVTSELQPKPALAEWDAVFRQPRR